MGLTGVGAAFRMPRRRSAKHFPVLDRRKERASRHRGHVPGRVQLPDVGLPSSATEPVRSAILRYSRETWGYMRKLYQPDQQPSRTSFRRNAALMGLHGTAQRIVAQLHKHHMPFLGRHDAKGIIYAMFYNIGGQNRVYVGKTGLLLSERFQGHLSKAISQSKRRLRHRAFFGVTRRGPECTELYSCMRHLPIRRLVMVPLEQLPALEQMPVDDDTTQAEHWERVSAAAEARWVMRLGALLPKGYNMRRPGGRVVRYSAIQAQAGDDVLWDRFHALRFDPQQPSPQTHWLQQHGYRDYDRRLRALHHVLVSQGPDAALTKLRSFKLGNVSRMLIIGRLHRVHHNNSHQALEAQPQLLDLLATELQRRQAEFVPNKGKPTQRCMLTPFWYSSLLDSVPLQGLLNNAQLLDLLPHHVTDKVRIMLAPKYPKPLIREWCKLKGVFDGSKMTHAELVAFSQTQPCPCQRLPAAYRDMLGADGHVVTTDPSVLTALCPGFPDLARLWARGAGYRPAQVLHNSPSHAATVLEGVQRAVDSLCQRMRSKYQVELADLGPWRDAFLAKVSQSIAELPANKRLAPDDSPFLSTDARRAMAQDVLSDYVVTVVDKAASSLTLICKRHAASLTLSDLHPDIGPSAFIPCPESPDQLLHRMQDHLHHLGYPPGDLAMPIYAAMPKLHKLDVGPLKWRFLSYSSNIFSTPLAVKLTWLFKGLHGDLVHLWNQLVFPPHLQQAYARHWVLMNSSEFVESVHCWNSSRSDAQHAQPPNLLSYDFERLYTNLDHNDFKQKLCAMLAAIFALHPDPAGGPSHVTVNAEGDASWLHAPLPPNVHARTPGGPACRFDLGSAQAAVCFLVDNSFIRVGDRAYRQEIGIPMGTNPAVFLANNYLFMLELQFFSTVLHKLHTSPVGSVTTQEATGILEAFAHTSRYIDDLALITTDSPANIEKWFYSDSVSAGGIPGIYPSFLLLKSTSADPPTTMDFLDVHVEPSIMPDGSYGPLITKLHDKRRAPAFSRVPVRRFPHIQSLLASKCKYGVLGSRLIHMSRIVTDPRNFIDESAILMASMAQDGCLVAKLLKCCRNLALRLAAELGCAPGVAQHGMRVFHRGQPGLFTVIKRQMERLLGR